MSSPAGIDPDVRLAAQQARRALNDSPRQQALRNNAEFFVAAVYWNPADISDDALRDELTRIRQTGLTAVRFHNVGPEWQADGTLEFTEADRWIDIAAQAGLNVILHVERLPDNPPVREKFGLDEWHLNNSFLDAENEKAYTAAYYTAVAEHFRGCETVIAFGTMGEPNAGTMQLEHPDDRARFAEWLKERYGTLEALNAAWDFYPRAGKPMVTDFADAWQHTFTDGPKMISGAEAARKVYGARRDMMRYQADKTLARARAFAGAIHAGDPDRICTTGNHQLFASQPCHRWDVANWARQGDLHATSIHMSWHFEAAEGEVDRPVYMQARMTSDWFKDAYTSAFETTGGAVQYSGGYPNSMSAGLMRRLCANYLAAGNQALAFWTWNHRPGGWEIGEYGLAGLSGEITPWAKAVGKVARGMGKYRRELWDATNEPQVALMYSWDTEAVLELEPQRHDLQHGPGRFSKGTRQQHQRALIGAARAMINEQVAFEYVTADEIQAGIAACYPAIYVPHARAVSEELLDALTEYVQAGGRLIADVQFAFADPWGKLRPTGREGRLAKLFGAWFETIHDTRTEPMSVGDMPVEGFFADVRPTDAKVLARFQDGRVAVTEKLTGRGSTVLIGFDAARMCHVPGAATETESLLGSLVRGHHPQPWQVEGAIGYRLSCDVADHYFLVNDGPACMVRIVAHDHAYDGGEKVIDGTPVDTNGTIAVPVEARSAAWVRLARKS